MNPYEFYTVWCLTLLAIVVLWASFCKLYIPLGIWQAVFAAYCGAAATGTLMVMAYRDDFIEKYLDCLYMPSTNRKQTKNENSDMGLRIARTDPSRHPSMTPVRDNLWDLRKMKVICWFQ